MYIIGCGQSIFKPISAVWLYVSVAIMTHRFGEVAEWSNVPDSKSGVGSNLPRVRIPPSPPNTPLSLLNELLKRINKLFYGLCALQ